MNVPCRSNAACFTYNIFRGSSQQVPGSLQEKNTYSLVHLWAGSQQDAQRIVQDLQQLQRLQFNNASAPGQGTNSGARRPDGGTRSAAPSKPDPAPAPNRSMTPDDDPIGDGGFITPYVLPQK